MSDFLWIATGLLCVIVTVLICKIRSLQKAAREIAAAFSEKLVADTNTLIDLSCRDPYMRALAVSLNDQLRLLRRQRQTYLNGDRELKEAVTNISHDLRTPLTAICGYLDLLEKEEKSESVARYLAYIENRTMALKQLTEELFRYSVVLSTAEDLKAEAIDLSAVLEESLAAFYGALTERGITPQITLSESRVIRHLDRDALGRILGNILTNVLKYSDGDLFVTLTDSGEIRFRNSASRLDEVQVGRLFERFFTVEAARSSTGLGLAIAKTLTDRMGGEITAHYENAKLSIVIKFAESPQTV